MDAEVVPARKRAQNWGVDEEVALIEEVKSRTSILFGSFKGSGQKGKGKEIKEKEWQTIVDKLNSQFDTKKRGLDEIKKKYYNIKSRSKEKLDSFKRPKTGGGPPEPPLTAGEETFLRLSESEPSVHGLDGGVDTDAPTFQVSEVNESQLQSLPQGSQCQEQTSNGKDALSSVDHVTRMVQNVKRKEKTGEAKGRKLMELQERNYILDNQRIEESIFRMKEKREVLALKKEVLLLKKQKLMCEIQSSYPDFLTVLSSEL